MNGAREDQQNRDQDDRPDGDEGGCPAVHGGTGGGRRRPAAGRGVVMRGAVMRRAGDCGREVRRDSGVGGGGQAGW